MLDAKTASFDLGDLHIKHNSHPGILMHLGSGATDLLPSDLSYVPSNMISEAGAIFVFRWRQYFTALFAELRHSASVVVEHQQTKNRHDIYHNSEDKSDRVPSLVEHATSLYVQSQTDKEVATPLLTTAGNGSEVAAIDSSPLTRTSALVLTDTSTTSSASLSQATATTYASAAVTVIQPAASPENIDKDEDDHFLLSPSNRIKLILRAGTSNVGVDGRYREVRRMRRRKIWLRENNLKTGEGACLCDLDDESEEMRKDRVDFERDGEAWVSRRLLGLVVGMERRGRRILW